MKNYPVFFEKRGQIFVALYEVRIPANVNKEEINIAKKIMNAVIRREMEIKESMLKKDGGKDYFAVKVVTNYYTSREILSIIGESISIFENSLLMKSIEKENELNPASS